MTPSGAVYFTLLHTPPPARRALRPPFRAPFPPVLYVFLQTADGGALNTQHSRNTVAGDCHVRVPLVSMNGELGALPRSRACATGGGGSNAMACATALKCAAQQIPEPSPAMVIVSQSVSYAAPYQWGMRPPESRTYAHIQYTRGQRSSHGAISAL